MLLKSNEVKDTGKQRNNKRNVFLYLRHTGNLRLLTGKPCIQYMATLISPQSKTKISLLSLLSFVYMVLKKNTLAAILSRKKYRKVTFFC